MTMVKELRGVLRLPLLQFLVLLLLIAILAGIACSQKQCVLDPDIWWHLRVGDWILQHHAVPHNGILSRTGSDRPWIAYSWGYEVLLAGAQAATGLVGVAVFGLVLVLAVAFTLFEALRRVSGRFWLSCGLATTGCYAFLFNIMPRPVFFSIILFTAVLALILKAERSGRAQPLYWLPVIFLLWANLHIQFVYGLFLVGLLVAANLLQRLATSAGIAQHRLAALQLPFSRLFFVFAACVVATCIGPYGPTLYKVIYGYAAASFTYRVIHELQPLDFRSLRHFVQLFLTAAAFYTLGSSKKMDLFRPLLLTAAGLVAFRTMRDSWFIVIPAVLCIAESLRCESADVEGRSFLRTAGLAVASGFVVLLLALNLDFNARGLTRTISGQYPVRAVEFIRSARLDGPLYNTLDWGGFLIWYLPEHPVAIDGRNDLYGDRLDFQFYQIQMGVSPHEADDILRGSRLVLLQREAPLASELNADPHFQLVYRDEIAVVFARR